jgi:hemoglobin/transferrin/lactoferrin receptor protein
MKVIFTMCFSFLGVVALAQTEEAPDSTYLLDEFVITANKIPEMRSKLAQQVMVMSTSQIKSLNVQNTADLLSNSGAVSMQKSQQGGGSPQIRGFEASRVVLVIDGVRMNNLIYRAGHLQNVLTLDNNSLERAEILLGPSSTVYGSDALGGVIHFKTKEVQLLTNEELNVNKGNAFFRCGTVNAEKASHIDVNIGGKRFGSFTSFTYSDFGDLRMGKRKNSSYGEEFGLRKYYVERSADNTNDVLVENTDPYIQKFSGYQQYDILQKFLFKQSPGISHSLNIQFSNSSNVPRYDRLTDPDPLNGLRMAEWYYGPQKRFMAAYHTQIAGVGKLADNFQSTISYQNVVESRHDRKFDIPDRRNQIEKVNVLALTIDLQKILGVHNLRYGFDGQLNTLQSSGYNFNVVTREQSPAATRYPDGDNSMNYYALYATHTVDINNQLTLNDGVRVGISNLRSAFNDKSFFPFPFNEVIQKNRYVCGNFGLIYKPMLSWKVSSIASTGYRVPNVDDLSKVFDTSAGNSLILPNPNVKPEKTINFDFGITKYFVDKVRWENTVYYTYFFDAIVLGDFTFNGQSVINYQGQPTRVLANQNRRSAYITGFTSIVHAALSSVLSVDASYNYTYGRVKTDSTEVPLDHIPPAFGRVSIRYNNNKFQVETFASFSGWKRLDDYLLNAEDNEVYATPKGTPSWYTLNLRLGYEMNKYLTLQAGMDNIFDLQYRTFSSGINAPGRNIFGTIRVSF